MLALSLLAGSADAWAKKRVVVVASPSRWDQAAQIAVEDVVQREQVLVSDTAVARAIKQLKLKKLNDDEVAALGAEVGADVVVSISVLPTKQPKMKLTVRDAHTGNIANTLNFSLRAPEVDDTDKEAIAAQLLPLLGKVGGAEEVPVAAAEPAPAPAPPPTPVAIVPAAATPAPAADAELATARHARHAAAEVEVGVAGVKRDLSFNYASALSMSQRPNSYSGAFVPALVVSGELYPLSLLSGVDPGGAAAGLGVAFLVDRVLLIKSKLGSAGTQYSTSQTRYGVGARYRWNFGHSATNPTLKLIAGFNHLDFTIDFAGDPVQLPSVSYSYLDVGGEGRFPLGTPRAALFVDARYLVVLSAGKITDPDSYGKATMSGFDGSAGLEVRITDRALAKLAVHYQRVAYTFDGSGKSSNDLDNDPSTQDVGGALDEYLGGMLSFGYLF